MIFLISCILIPFLTVLMSGGKNFLTSNFSVTADSFLGRCYLVLWAITVGGYFRFLIKRIIGQAAPYFSADRELVLTDISVSCLLIAVLFPYRPTEYPSASMAHVIFGLIAAVSYYLVLLSLALRFYFVNPQIFSVMSAMFLYSAFPAAVIYYVSGFIISSALEIFVTVFSSFWLAILCRMCEPKSEPELLLK